MRAHPALVVLLCLTTAGPALAGAWTRPAGGTQLITSVTYSRATYGFDNSGAATVPLRYEKVLVQLCAEYGWNDWLTLIAEPEYAHARLVSPSQSPTVANDAAVEGGVRIRLLNKVGILSAQLSAKTAGAFDMSVSASGAPGRQLEIRLLYGTNFTLFGEPGFFDAEVGQRWIAGKRADETPIDLTLGLRVLKRERILLQSFNVIAQNNASPPYGYYRSHKVALSIVTDIRPGLCLQSGGYISPGGQNALGELGFSISLWAQF